MDVVVSPPRQDEEPAWAEIGQAPASKPLGVTEAGRKLGSGAGVEPSTGGVLGWTLVVLALIAAAAVGVRRLLRRSGLLGADGAMSVLARRAIGPRQDLVLVEVGARVFLIGATRDRLVTLGEFARAEEIAQLRARCPSVGGAEAEFRTALRERMRETERTPAGTAGYTDIAAQISEIRKTVDGWRAT